MDATPDDRALLAAHLAGDDEAFGILFTRHRDRLWAVALRTTGDPEDAADALQDALISAFRRADSFRGESAVSTWLHRIVVNACLDRLRRNRVRAADPLPDDLEGYTGRGSLSTRSAGSPLSSLGSSLGSPPASGLGSPVDPGEALLEQERRDVVHRALATLPPDQRAALVLVDMQGYPVEEAARILDCAVGTVKSRCHRGRARLAPLLADLRPHHPSEPASTRVASAGPVTAPTAQSPTEPPAGQSRPTPGKGGAEA